MRALLFAAIFFFIIASPVFAFDVFGAEGNPVGEKDFIGQGTGNIQNWPQKVQDMCKKAQDNAVKACQDYVSRLNLNPGGWWVDRMISAKSFTPRTPSIDVNIQDHIVGKFDCPPHDLLTDSEGHLVTQVAIYSEIIDYGKSSQKRGAKHIPGGDESIQITCSFSCSAWPCAAGTDEFRNCEDTYFDDTNGDGVNDGQRSEDGGGWSGKTKKEIIDRIINGEPTAEGGYYFGLKLICEGEEKIPWYKFWKDKKCKLKDCVTEEIPYRGFGTDVQPGRSIIRVCCGCTCTNKYMTPNFDPARYVPLGYDPFVEIFTPKPIERVLEEDIDESIRTYDTLPRLPAGIKNIFGDDAVDINIDAGNRINVPFAVGLVDGKVTGIKKGTWPGAKVKVNTDQATYLKIKGSKDPAGALVKAINDKSIKYSATGITGAVKVGIVNLAAGLLGGSAQTVRPGNSIVINGQTGVVKVNPNNVFIVQYNNPTIRTIPVINSYGNSYGYTNTLTQNFISSAPPRTYSVNTGIYNYPTSNYANYWTTQSYRPSVPSRGYTPTTAMQTAYAGYTYAGRGGFGGVSGATYSTVGFRA